MKKLHILLAEDNQGDIVLIRHALREHQIEHDLRVVTDGAAAIEFIQRVGTQEDTALLDLFLLDLNLPKADGTEVLKYFRAHPGCATTPIIVVTSSGSERDRSRVNLLGIKYYFQKPLDFDRFLELGALVKEVVGASR